MQKKKIAVEMAQLNVRIPVQVIEVLRAMAEREHRSIAKQLVHIIEESTKR